MSAADRARTSDEQAVAVHRKPGGCCAHCGAQRSGAAASYRRCRLPEASRLGGLCCVTLCAGRLWRSSGGARFDLG